MTFIRMQVKAGSWMLPTRALPAWARTLTRSLLEVNGGHCPTCGDHLRFDDAFAAPAEGDAWRLCCGECVGKTRAQVLESREERARVLLDALLVATAYRCYCCGRQVTPETASLRHLVDRGSPAVYVPTCPSHVKGAVSSAEQRDPVRQGTGDDDGRPAGDPHPLVLACGGYAGEGDQTPVEPKRDPCSGAVVEELLDEVDSVGRHDDGELSDDQVPGRVVKVTDAHALEVPMCPRHLADTFHLAAYRRPDLVELRAFRISESVAS